MKKLAIIGAGYLQEPLVLKAKEMGLYTICFAWKEGAVCAEVVDKFYPISIIEKEEILAICISEKIDGICTIASDVAAPTVAYVANNMGIIGNNYDAAVRANNKALMREAFYKADVPCPWFQKITSYTDLKDKDLKFPLIVKPVDRSGSMGVSKVNNNAELRIAINQALSDSFLKQAMVEQFVDGREISVEFISYKGQHYPLAITDKVTTEAPHFVELEHHQPSNLSDAIKAEINAITVIALNALEITNGASHTEYKITADGEIFIIELGARMGGDFIGSDLVQLSTGYDFLKGVIEVALNKFNVPILNRKSYSGVYFLCKETEYVKPYILNYQSHPQIIKAEISNEELKNITCSAERSGYFIYQSNKKVKI